MSALEEYRKEISPLRNDGEWNWVVGLADAAIAELEAALAERDRMLRLAWAYVPWPKREEGFVKWLADLRARAKESK